MKRIRCAALLAVFFLAGGKAFSFSFQPLSMEFSPVGKGSIRTFRITNDSDKPIAVKVSMLTREMDIDGKEKNADASSLFLVFPPQVFVQPGTYQAVRVQWKGPGTLDTERAFRILAEQLPVKFGEESKSGGSLNIMLRYKGSVYVTPGSARHSLEVTGVTLGTGPDGNRKLIVEVTNEGNAHVIMQDLAVEVNTTEGGGTKFRLEGQELQGMNGENILAGNTRRFYLDPPSGLTGGKLDASLAFKPVK